MRLNPFCILKSHRSTANGSVPAPRSASGPLPPSSSRVTKKRSTVHWLAYWFKPAFAFLVYAVTLYVAASAPFHHTLLGRVSASLGTWFLVLLAKGGDIIFGFAVADTFDTLTWRKLKERKGRMVSGRFGRGYFGGMRLDWFLALVSSTNVEGLAKILLRSTKKDKTRKSAAKWTAVARLIFILALIPGPGIILTANIRQQSVFFDQRSMNVSGGLADFDPSVGATYQTVYGAETSKLAQIMLRDRTVTWPVPPISSDCQSNKGCISYLLAGPYQTIAPWPFDNETNVDAFRLYNAPFYQVEFWNTSPGLMFSASKDCTLYGGFDRVDEFSTIMCISQETANAPLVAGWASCQQGYSKNFTCLSPGTADSTWNTHIHFFRRHATITFSRRDLTILDVSQLSSPLSYPVSPPQLFESLGNVLYRPNTVTTDPRFDVNSQQYVLTQKISSDLYNLLSARARTVPFARDWLQNLLAMQLYVFQPTMLAVGAQIHNVFNGTAVQPNLPAENYVKGAYCTVDTRSIPGRGTVVAYAVVGGLVLAFIGAGKAIATLWPEIHTSDFPVLDFEALTLLVDDQPQPRQVSLSTVLDEQAYRERKQLDKVADLRVGLSRV